MSPCHFMLHHVTPTGWNEWTDLLAEAARTQLRDQWEENTGEHALQQAVCFVRWDVECDMVSSTLWPDSMLVIWSVISGQKQDLALLWQLLGRSFEIGCRALRTAWWSLIARGSMLVLPSLWTATSHILSKQDRPCYQDYLERISLCQSSVRRVVNLTWRGLWSFSQPQDLIIWYRSSSLRRGPANSNNPLTHGQECSTIPFPGNQWQVNAAMPRAFPFHFAMAWAKELALLVMASAEL